jgi:hypothetical protein
MGDSLSRKSTVNYTQTICVRVCFRTYLLIVFEAHLQSGIMFV